MGVILEVIGALFLLCVVVAAFEGLWQVWILFGLVALAAGNSRPAAALSGVCRSTREGCVHGVLLLAHSVSSGP